MIFPFLNPIVIVAAAVPAVVLLIYVYRKDRLEIEPSWLLASLVILGIASTTLAMLIERFAITLLDLSAPTSRILYSLVLFFVIVGPAEEGMKYLLLRFRTWNQPAFNCQFDGVVYAVFVSLGFALWENIGYVMQLGLTGALLRSVTAVPGHACFGVFMGAWYGMAKRFSNAGDEERSRAYRRFSFVIPALIHGAYDFFATLQVAGSTVIFVAFIIAMFIISIWLINKLSREDAYI